MSHALLLRLFLSPYFSISVAMHYLKTYSDSIGISHYLCWRMRGMSMEEVESYWPQICHLLITYPTQSNALESFVLERAEESTHSAMLTFWFMQAALRDLTPTRQTNPRPFLICQRILHRCHAIIFGDPPEPTNSPYRSLPSSPADSVASLTGVQAGGRAGSRSLMGKMLGKGKNAMRVNEHALPALIGMGVVMSAQGMPHLRETVGEWAIMQGRQPRDDDTQGKERAEGDEAADEPKAKGPNKVSRDASVEKPERESSGEESPSSRARNTALPLSHPATPRTRQLGTPIGPAQTTPNLSSPSRFSSDRDQRLTYPQSSPLLHTPPGEPINPFSMDDMDDPIPHSPRTPGVVSTTGKSGAPSTPRVTSYSGASGHQHYHSFPDLSRLHTPDRPASAGPAGRNVRGRLHPTDQSVPAEFLLANYSIAKQRQLLKSHYTRSEIRFLLLLEDISNRLLVVPKPARVPALRAELTSLNHNLPAEVCMPLWCTADHSHDDPSDAGSSTFSSLSPNKLLPERRTSSSWSTPSKTGHSRVVRISPGDSVVLNSAERAPFLLHVEILEGDLDFDPSKRENRDLLRKIVTQEDNRRRKKELGLHVGTSGPFGMDAEDSSGRRVGLGIDGFGSAMPESLPPPKTPDVAPARGSQGPQGVHGFRKGKQPLPDIDVEEVDLVEQMYGARLSVRDNLPDLTDSLPLPSGPKNKALDAAAWDRGEALSSSRRPSFTPPSSAAFSMGGEEGGDVSVTSGDAVGLGDTLQPTASDRRPSFSASRTPADISRGDDKNGSGYKRVITLEDYSERMRTAAVMLAQLNASLVPAPAEGGGGRLSWLPGTGWITGNSAATNSNTPGGVVQSTSPADLAAAPGGTGGKLRLAAAQAEAIRSRIMEEMMALEEERVARMTARPDDEGEVVLRVAVGQEDGRGESEGTAEDEGIVRRELNKADPSAAVFKESWAAKKSRIRASSPWGHLANWDVISVIVKTGTDLRQEQLATQLIERFSRIFREEKSDCWVRFFRILITGEQSGLVETITDAVSVHSIKKGEYARRLAEGGPMGRVSLLDHFISTYGKPDSGRFARAQRAFIRSLAGYSVVTYLLQIKDRHNGNILVDRDGHLIHIDFGFMLSNSPGGNMGFEAAPFKFPLEYVEIIGGLESVGWKEFKRVFKEGFEAARKHSDSLITMVELMQKDSKLDCFTLFGDQTAHHFRERFALNLTTAAVDAHLERLIVSSMGSNYTRLYDTFQYYSQGVL